MTDEPERPADDGDPMIVRLDGPTPAGGAYAVLTYLDDAGTGVPRSRANRIRIEEFGTDGIVLATSYGNI